MKGVEILSEKENKLLITRQTPEIYHLVYFLPKVIYFDC